jgi:hypothetical protein
MERNLISLADIHMLARPCSTDADAADSFIAEAQRTDVRPRISDAVYLMLFEHPEDQHVITLWEGGVWRDRCNAPHVVTGLKTTLAYYALARIIRDGNIQATTYGAVVKDDSHSTEALTTERSRQYRELFAQADGYMSECLRYLDTHAEKFPGYTCAKKSPHNRMSIRVLKKI